MRRGICPRVSGGKKFSPLSFIGRCNMEAKRTLSVFVTDSEYKFFGGPSAFRRYEAKFLAAHALD